MTVLIVIAAAVGGAWLAYRLAARRQSGTPDTGVIVLYEAHFEEASLGDTPALVVRGARESIERFIPIDEFPALFGGYALWRPSRHPTPELPGEALGVWSRRTCKRFRRILRERGASIELRQEQGPPQRLARMVAR